MEAEIPKLVIIDYTEDPNYKPEEPPPPIPESFGYNLDTVEKARRWLTHPQNWFRSELFIIRWNGLLPMISEKHGRRLIAEPWDNGLPEVVVWEQRKRRSKNDRGEQVEDPEPPQPQDE